MKKKIQSNVIQLRNDLASVKALKEVIQMLKSERIDAFVVMAYEKYDEKKRKELNSMGAIHRFWFADGDMGCLDVLGLLDEAKEEVRRYMREENEED